MADVVEHVVGQRRYHVYGLQARAAEIERVVALLGEDLSGSITAARTALDGWSGPLAGSFADQFNAVASRMVTVQLDALDAAADCRSFPNAGRTSGVYTDYAYMAARVDVPPSSSGAVGADPETMRSAAERLSGLRSPCTAVAVAVTTDGVTATVTDLRYLTGPERERLTEQGVPPQIVAAEQVWGDPEPVPIAQLFQLADLTGEASAAGTAADDLGAWTAATAMAVENADAALMALLLEHPELAGFLDTSSLTEGHMSGEGALLVVLANLGRLDTLGRGGDFDGVVGLSDLEAAVDDPQSSELLRAAAAYLLANRLFLSQASLDDQTPYEIEPAAARLDADGIRRFLEFNASLRAVMDGFDVLDTAAHGDDPDGNVSENDLQAVAEGSGHPAELTAAAEFLLANPALAQRMGLYAGANIDRATYNYGMGRTLTPYVMDFGREAVMAIAVDQQAYAGDPAAARRFVLDLPQADRDGDGGINVWLLSDEGVRALANAALLDTHGDLSDAHAVIAHLPETTGWNGTRGAVEQRGGVRNQLMNSFYDLMADRADTILAGPELAGHPSLPGHPGANWLKFAPWASSTVGGVIRGDTTGPLGFLPGSVQQGAADGNQWIFNDIGQRFTAFIELYETSPNPSEAELERFLDTTFADGDGTIRNGFAAYVASMEETDPVQRQRLMYQGNVLVAIHEQAGAQTYLEEVSWGPDGIAAAFVDAEVAGEHLDMDTDLPSRAGANNLIASQPILSMDVGSVTAADLSRGNVQFAVAGGTPTTGVIDLDPIAGTEQYRPDFSPSSTVWFEEGGPPDYIVTRYTVIDLPDADPESLKGTGATEWPDWEERMNAISRMFEQYHTDRELYDTTEIIVPFDRIEWLDEAARPRMRFVALGLVLAALTIGVACGDDSPGEPPAASSRPGDDEIEDLIDRIWSVIGVPVEDVAVGDYQYHRPLTWCDDLPRADRWVGERSSYVAADAVEPAAAEDALVEVLAADGFAVQRYRSTHPDDRSRAVEGIKDGARVYGYLGPGSPTDINVRVGPCAPSFGYLDPELYEPDPEQPDA